MGRLQPWQFSLCKLWGGGWKNILSILALKFLDRFSYYLPVNMWRCWVVLKSSKTAVTLLFKVEFSEVNRIPSKVQILLQYDLWKREKRECTQVLACSQRTHASGQPEITSRNARIPTPGWPWESLSKLSHLIDLDFFLQYGGLCDLFKYFYCGVRKLVRSAPPSGSFLTAPGRDLGPRLASQNTH